MDSLEQPNVHWIMGMLSTKDHQEIFEILLRKGDRLSLVPVEGHASADLEELCKIAEKTCSDLSAIAIYDSLENSLVALQHLEEPSQTTILCGSLYLLGQYLSL